MDLAAEDVIRLILQFMREQQLPRAFAALEAESAVHLNAVESTAAITQDILAGRWDAVLDALRRLSVPDTRLFDLYEQIIMELVDMEETSAARSILRQTNVTAEMKDKSPDRYLRLEELVSKGRLRGVEFTPEARLERRAAIAKNLEKDLIVVPPSRLLTLLGQAIRNQIAEGKIQQDAPYDLFRGVCKLEKMSADAPAVDAFQTIKFSKKHPCEAAIFTSDSLITGTEDGFIEVWSYMTGKLRKDLAYQAEEKFMIMESAVLSFALSADEEHLASGSEGGKIKIWKVATGACVLRLQQTSPVTSLRFISVGGKPHLLATGHDCVRVFGLKTGSVVKEMRGHASYINTAVCGGDLILSGSSDGSLKIWDIKTTNCLSTVTFPVGTMTPNVLKIVQSETGFFVFTQSSTVHLMGQTGEILKKYELPMKAGMSTEIITGAVSVNGEFLYAATSDELYVFSVASGKVEQSAGLNSEVKDLAHHPGVSIMALSFRSGNLVLMKPKSN